MATKKNTVIAPLTFDLPSPLIEKIAALKKKSGLRSASEVVRVAIASIDLERCAATRVLHRQISVRLPAEMRAKVVRVAKRKQVSAGEIVRIAIEACGPRPGTQAPAKTPARASAKTQTKTQAQAKAKSAKLGKNGTSVTGTPAKSVKSGKGANVGKPGKAGKAGRER